MPRISLILAGAVSLGSFEAGVLDELLYVLDRLNRGRADDDPYVLDSIAGASAGAMTAALVAQAVMRGFDKRRLLHRAWVDEIDITYLLRDIPANALLNKTAIGEIGRRFLPYQGGAPGLAARGNGGGESDGGGNGAADPPSSSEPSSLAGETLRMAFTVSNMTGVNYRLPARSHGDDAVFESTFHAERREYALDRDDPSADPWDDIRESAIASGNFPIAFAAHPLAAVEQNWPSHALDPFPQSFWYVDGGMFNNEPVGEAVRLARKIDDPDARARIDPDRLFVLVDANLNRAAHDPDFSEESGLIDTTKRLVTAMADEATANDWLKALRRNNEVGWRDKMIETMADLVRKIGVADPGGLLAQLEEAGDDIVARKRAVLGEARYPASYRVEAVDRLLGQFSEHLDRMGPTQTRIFGNLIFLLNSVAGLDKKQQLNLSMVHADATEVAGDQLHSFAGFFSRDWRQHDYTVGRAKTRAALPGILGIPEHELPDPEPGVPYEPDVDLRDVTMANAPRDAREALRDATMAKVEAMTEDLAVGPKWTRWATGPVLRGIVRKGVKGKLNETLEL